MQMAADQRKKPVATFRVVASSQEEHRRLRKRKKLGLMPYDLNARSNISLEWDDKNNNVVAKREQIALTQRHLIAFDDYVSHGHTILVDVLSLPREIFDLDILKEVLSHEVWQTLLTAHERHYLMQFLPKGVDMHKLVQELLAEQSIFHFCNPFLKWSLSLCSGNLHPDAILHQEHCIRASKKMYYFDLEKYHNGMINNLLTWKEKWATSKNPDEEIVQSIWRSRKQDRNMSSNVNEYELCNPPEEVVGTSESDSLDADENDGRSDNKNLFSHHRELQQRNIVAEDRCNNYAAVLKMVERPKRGETVHRQNIQCGDGAKYMSYIKVSRKQHQRVKSSMKNSSNSIQTRSLNGVLGNLHNFHVQPFEVFEEEEQKKLHAHWLQLAIKDVPAAFEKLKKCQLGKSQLLHNLKEEMEQKLLSNNEVEEKEHSYCLLQEHLDDKADDGKFCTSSKVVENEKTDSISEEVMVDGATRVGPSRENGSQFARGSIQDQHLQKISESRKIHELCSVEKDPDNYAKKERDGSQLNSYSENLKRVDNAVGAALSTSSNALPPVSAGNTHYCSSLSYNYDSAQLLSLRHPGNLEHQQTRLIDLESDSHEDVGQSLWQKQLHNGSVFNAYTDRDVRSQNEFLPHYFRGPDLPYHHEQKQTPFDLQQLSDASSVSVGRSPYSRIPGKQPGISIPLDLMREKRLIDMDADQNIKEKMFSGGFSRNIPVPMQQHLSSVNIQDWAVNTAHMSSPLQSYMGGVELDRNSLVEDDQTCGGWSNLDPNSHGTGNSRSSVDQSFYDSLSLYNTESPYPAPCNVIEGGGSTQQFLESGFGTSYNGGVVPSANNVLLQAHDHHPLDYLSGQETIPPLAKSNNPLGAGWINIAPHHNSVLQNDSMGKPFLRSWNS